MHTEYETFVDEENIEYKRFLNTSGKHCVRVTDLDSGNVFQLLICISEEQAIEKYAAALPKY
jgi:hypothetical protein